MARYIPLSLGAVFIVIAAVFQGSMTQRWQGGLSNELRDMVARYESIPYKIGDWVGEDSKVSKGEMKSAGAHAYISRVYRNTKTQDVVSVFLICGYGRDVAVHTPDICYVAQGFTLETNPQPYTIPAGDTKATMFVSRFQKRKAEGGFEQRIFWAWNAGDGWLAPDRPRWKYVAGEPLNKLYLISSAPGDLKGPPQATSIARFASELLPELSRIIFPSRPSA